MGNDKVLAKAVHLGLGVDLLGSKTSLNAKSGNELEVTPLGIKATGRSGRVVLVPWANIKGVELEGTADFQRKEKLQAEAIKVAAAERAKAAQEPQRQAPRPPPTPVESEEAQAEAIEQAEAARAKARAKRQAEAEDNKRKQEAEMKKLGGMPKK